MTIWQQNVDAFIERRDETGEQIDHARHTTIQNTLEHLGHHTPGRAFHTLLHGVRRQWQLAGTGELQLGTRVDIAWPPLAVVPSQREASE